MTYLANFAGEPLSWAEVPSTRMPLFLRERFVLGSTQFFGRPLVFALEQPAHGKGSPGEYEKLAGALRAHMAQPVVLVLSDLPAYARNRLVRQGVPFVVPGSQLFLPTAVIDLRERFPRPRSRTAKRLTPTAQSLLLYHLQKESLDGLPLKEVARRIGCSPIMATKVRDELEAAELGEGARNGRAVTLRFGCQGRQLWERALPFLGSPVRRTRWLQSNSPHPQAPVAGLTALSQLTAIQDAPLPTQALLAEAVRDGLEAGAFRECEGPEEAHLRMECWSYDPLLVGDSRRVDPLSLYLSLRDSLDERVQQQLSILIGQIPW